MPVRLLGQEHSGRKTLEPGRQSDPVGGLDSTMLPIS